MIFQQNILIHAYNNFYRVMGWTQKNLLKKTGLETRFIIRWNWAEIVQMKTLRRLYFEVNFIGLRLSDNEFN